MELLVGGDIGLYFMWTLLKSHMRILCVEMKNIKVIGQCRRMLPDE